MSTDVNDWAFSRADAMPELSEMHQMFQARRQELIRHRQLMEARLEIGGYSNG